MPGTGPGVVDAPGRESDVWTSVDHDIHTGEQTRSCEPDCGICVREEHWVVGKAVLALGCGSQTGPPGEPGTKVLLPREVMGYELSVQRERIGNLTA